MKIFLVICLASGLASSEKLDRSYLPPPGSKFSGGSPGDIDVPLEFPKQTPTGRPQVENGKPEIELGINRRPAPTGTTDSKKPGFTYFQKSYPVPKTTTTYAITQTTTYPPSEDVDQHNTFINGTSIQSGFPGQNYQPIRGPGEGPSYNLYRPGQSQSTVAPYGTTLRPQFPGTFNGLEYLPPVSDKQSPNQVFNQDGSNYPSDLPQGPKYQDGQTISVKHPGYVSSGISQQNQYLGNQLTPSTTEPQYQDGRFAPTGPGSQQNQNQFPGSQYPSSTTAPQYQFGQRFTTPGANKQNIFLGNQEFPSSTAAPQYQDSQRFTTPGANQQNRFIGNKEFPSSTTAPQFQDGQSFPTSGLNQQVFGSRVPSHQIHNIGNKYQGNQFPTSTAAPTPGSIQQNQYSGIQNYPTTVAPNYQNGQRFTTPGQSIGGLIPGQRLSGNREPGQNEYSSNENLPSSTIDPQFQDRVHHTTTGYVQQGYGYPVPNQQNQNLYPGNQNFPSSTSAPQYQNGQQFTTGPLSGQNFPTTAAPIYQGGQRLTTPSQYQGQLVTEQQFIARIPNHQGQSGNQNYPSSTILPQYQDGQRFSTPGSQRFGSTEQNQYGNQHLPTSTAAPQYQDQRFSTPGQVLNQPTYPESTAVPQYQQSLAPTSTYNQDPRVLNQQNQFQQPNYNQQIPSSTASPQRFIPGSQPQHGNGKIPTSGTEVTFPQQQGLPESQIFGTTQQPSSQTVAGSSVYGTAPSFTNQGFPTTVGFLPVRDHSAKPGFESIGGGRPERPQAEVDRNAEILSYENVLTPEGYFYSYDTSNGIHADETGTVGNGTRAEGGYSYTGDDGKVYSVVYSADENGFRPRGDHLPTPPPIPEAIQRVIDQAHMDREAGIDDDGSYNEDKYGHMKYEGPLRRAMSKNKTISLVNGVDIPEAKETGIGKSNRKLLRPKGSRLGSNLESSEEFESDSEKTDINDSDSKEVEEASRDDDKLNDKKEGNRRTSAKRPKPIKNLTVEDNRHNQKQPKSPMKPNDMTRVSQINISEKTDSSRRPISTKDYEENTSGVTSEDSDESDDAQDYDSFDFDSDLVNYKDDPNNRTDFHGLNKYLPESKKSHRKNQSAKKRPTLKVDGMRNPEKGLSEAEASDDEAQDTKPDFIHESRTHTPSRKNKFRQKVKDQSKITDQGATGPSDDEITADEDGSINSNDEYDSEDASKSVTNDSENKPVKSQLRNKNRGKPKRPTGNQQTGISSNNKDKSLAYEETGYEYIPPQRKFEEANKFPPTLNQKGVHTTVRPFLTKHVYGEENEPSDEYVDQYENVKTNRPSPGDQKYPGYNQGSDSYVHNDRDVNKDNVYSTTGRPVSYGTRRPFGRPQTSAIPQYQEQGVTGQDGEGYQTPEVNEQGFSTTRRPISYGTFRQPFGRPQTTLTPNHQDKGDQVYNEPVSNQGSQRLGDKLLYNTNAPNKGTVGNVFSSTTPLPPSGSDPSRYQRPGYQNRPTDGTTYYDTTSPSRGNYGLSNRPGQVPSTTYRPNYTFGDKTSPVAVDDFGQPIPSTSAPAFDQTLRPTYTTSKPDQAFTQTGQFKPNQGRFGVTSGPEAAGYQSTSAPIGEDFRGPKQPQRFDPETGYHYK